jgi:hypothetical protein
MVESGLSFWARGHGANRFSKAVGSDERGGSEETCMHIHGTGSTSATRLNSVPIMATMYRIPREQCPFHERINETKSSPAITGVRYCSVLPGESFRCRSGHGPNLTRNRGSTPLFALWGKERSGGHCCPGYCLLLLQLSSPTTIVPVVLGWQ